MTIESPTSVAAEGDGGLRAILEHARQIWKRRLLVLAVATAASSLVALWVLRQPKIYEAFVSMEFEPNPPRPLGREVREVTDEVDSYLMTREYYVTQFRIIESQRIAEAVVRQLGLQHDADFLGVRPTDRRAFRSVPVAAAAGLLRGRLRVDPVRDSRLVVLHVEDTSPRRAQLLANTIATVYIRQNLEKKLSTTVSALEWLGQQLETLRSQLDASEMALHQFRVENNLLSVSYEDRRNTIGNRIEKLSDGLTEVQLRRIGISSRVAELRRAAQSNDPLVQQAPELLASSVLTDLRNRYEEARRTHETLGTRYGPEAQQMRAAASAMDEIRDAIRSEVHNILGSAEAELRSARRLESDLQGAINVAQEEGLRLNLREIRYGQLLREREHNVKLYGLVLERSKETDLTRLLRVNNVRVLDEAMLPAVPSKPRVLMTIFAGLLAGGLLGIGVASVVAQLDRTVRSQHDIEDELKATFLGLVPKIHEKAWRAGYYRYGYGRADTPEDHAPITNPDLVVHTHPNSAVAEACRVIRTNLLFMSPDAPFRSLIVSSASAREGKTTVAVSLAITLAQSGKRVLLVDTDLRRPRVHKVFKLRPPVGMTSLLVGEVSFEEAVIPTDIPNLSILPAGPIPPNPSELLHSQRFQDVLQEGYARFDRVVFDSPPIGAVSDALVVAPQVDGTVLVTRSHQTPRARANAVLSQLRAIGARIAGVILNDVDLSRDGGGAYYYEGAYQYRASSSEETA